jgi:hypothetical protein
MQANFLALRDAKESLDGFELSVHEIEVFLHSGELLRKAALPIGIRFQESKVPHLWRPTFSRC